MKWLLAGRRTRVLQTGNPKGRHLCVYVEEALGDRGTSLDTRNSVEANSPCRVMPRASLSRLLKPWAVSRCMCLSIAPHAAIMFKTSVLGLKNLKSLKRASSARNRGLQRWLHSACTLGTTVLCLVISRP